MELPQHILALIDKYLAADITKEELKTLNAWYHEFDDHQAFVDLEGQSMSTFEDSETEAHLSRTIYNRLMKETALQPRRKKIRIWKSYAAAITLLILICGTGYFYLNQQKKTSSKVKIAIRQKALKGDLAPGSNKARLTLSDGSVILLDSAHNGTIGQQGNVSIQKVANGTLSYHGNKTSHLAAVYNEMTTPRGGTYQITLADGTRVWLNAATSLRFPTAFPGHTREVSVKGEAYFEVAKNAHKPFLVHTDKETIRVLGTHFNVNAYQDEPVYRTTLLEGKVKVKSKGSAGMEAELSPGQQATVQPSGKLSINLHPDLEQVTGWKDGKFIFRSTDFRTILRLISRWYDADIVYQGEENPVFTGQLSKQLPVSKVFAMLSLTNALHYTITGNKIIVTSK